MWATTSTMSTGMVSPPLGMAMGVSGGVRSPLGQFATHDTIVIALGIISQFDAGQLFALRCSVSLFFVVGELIHSTPPLGYGDPVLPDGVVIRRPIWVQVTQHIGVRVTVNPSSVRQARYDRTHRRTVLNGFFDVI